MFPFFFLSALPLAGQGCLCVNPGQLAKGTGGGTYAELAVHPMPQDMLAKKQEGERLVRRCSFSRALDVK